MRKVAGAASTVPASNKLLFPTRIKYASRMSPALPTGSAGNRANPRGTPATTHPLAPPICFEPFIPHLNVDLYPDWHIS